MLAIHVRALKFRRVWLAMGFSWATIIFVASLIPLAELPIKVNIWDKLEHFIAYSSLAFWFGMIVDPRKMGHLVLVGAIAFGMFIEILQGRTSYRSFDWFDMIANSIGAFVGVAMALSALGKLLKIFDMLLEELLYRNKT